MNEVICLVRQFPKHNVRGAEHPTQRIGKTENWRACQRPVTAVGGVGLLLANIFQPDEVFAGFRSSPGWAPYWNSLRSKGTAKLYELT